MRVASTSLALVASATSFVAAFSDSYPLVAWTSHRVDSLPAILGTNGKQDASPFRSGSQQIPLKSEQEIEGGDLCSLSTVLIVSAPGMHYSDMALLPSSRDSQQGIKAAIEYAASTASEGEVSRHPYLPLKRTSASSPAQRLAGKFGKECGAVVETSNLKNLWAGEQGKTLRVEMVEGLEEWELAGVDARKGRAGVMQQIDDAIASHLGSLEAPFLVVLTSMSPASVNEITKSSLPARHAHAKRQHVDDAYSESGSVSSYGEYADDSAYDAVEEGSEWGSAGEASRIVPVVAYAPKENSTSIFSPKKNSGLLHRYVFLSTPLIFALIIVGLIILPVLVLTSQALTTVETVRGLETKMTGSVNVDAAKSG